MKINPLYFPAVILVIALLFYFGNFHAGFSRDQSVWGAFGDFIGGVLNPVLTFTTVYLLIKSLDSQNRALINSEAQTSEARSISRMQRATEEVKQFESLFFVFSEIAANNYVRFSIYQNSKNLLGHEAITHINLEIEDASRMGKNLPDLFSELDERNHASIYELVQSYCSLFKIISELCPTQHQQKYFSIAVSLIPSKVMHLLCMAEAFTKWPILVAAKSMGLFDKPATSALLKHFQSLK